MNTRPFLATHRRDYDKVPRLFPAQTVAELLHPPPIPFDRHEFEAHWEHNRMSHGKSILVPDEPRLGMVTSPGVSDVEITEVQPRRKRPHSEFFDGDFPEMIENAEQALNETRYLQRHSWRSNAVNPAAPPPATSDDIMDYAFNESIENLRELSTADTSAKELKLPDWVCTGNPLSVVRIGEKRAVVCALTGSLDSLATYDVEISRSSSDGILHRLSRKGRASSVPSALVFDTSPVTDIVTSDWDGESSEPCTAVVATTNSLNFVNIATGSGQPTREWRDHFSFPSSFSLALNPLYPAEFVALCRQGLFFGTAEEFVNIRSQKKDWDDCFHDIQGIARSSWYSRVFYGMHPRCLLVSNRKEVAIFDMREKIDLESRNVMFNVKEDWNLPENDSSISFFQPLRPRGYTALIATRTCLNYFDMRMPKTPILDWSISLSVPIEKVCVANLDQQHPRSHVFAMASRRQSYLEVFHAVHTQGQGTLGFAALQSQRPENGRSAASCTVPELRTSPVLWSDMPLAHMQQLNGASGISGMALLPLNGDRSVSLLQWSPKDGLMGQLLDIEARKDGESVFERQTGVKGRVCDNSINMTNYIRRMLDCGDFKHVSFLQKPVSESLGNDLLRSSKKLLLQDARRLRSIFLNDGDDDYDNRSTVRFPRPFLSDIPRIVEIRRASRGGAETREQEADGPPRNGNVSRALDGAGPSKTGTDSDSELGNREISLKNGPHLVVGTEDDAQEALVETQHESQELPRSRLIRLPRGADERGAAQPTYGGEGSVNDSGGEDMDVSEDSAIAEAEAIFKDIVESSGDASWMKRLGSAREPTLQSGNLGARSSSNSSSSNSSSESPNSSSESLLSRGSGVSGSLGSAGSVTSSGSEGSGMGGLITGIGHGKLLDEIGREVRAGMAHCRTVLKPGVLRKIVEESEAVLWHDVEWHAGCTADHGNFDTAVTTKEELPDWVCTRVYRIEKAIPGTAMKNTSFEEDSPYVELLKKMKRVFFEGRGES